jgi:hypothetical protein
MGKTRIKWNNEGFRQLRQDPGIKRDLMNRAERIAASAGGQSMGYMVTDLVLEEPRGAVSVMATGKARADNRKHNSLIRALDAGKG